MNALDQVRAELGYKLFVIAAVSSNRNSFGLNQYVFVAEDGEAWAALANKSYQRYQQGDKVLLGSPRGMALAQLSFECPHALPDCPATACQEVFA
jgi:hypothetical protein